MNWRLIYKQGAQLLLVLLSALALKQYYATASVDQLRWILAPTTFVVELLTGSQFEFESHAGYMSSDRRFVIAASCAGVNFLITAFLMLSLRKLWSERKTSWRFIPAAGLVAYLATIVANTFRISTALYLQRTPLEIGWLNENQLHRLEGIFIYFGFLLLLFLVSERKGRSKRSEPGTAPSSIPDQARTFSSNQADARVRPATSESQVHRDGLLRQSFFPLLVYYATTLGIPLATSAYRTGPVASDFLEHSAFVLLAPLILLLLFATFRLAVRVASRGLPTADTHAGGRNESADHTDSADVLIPSV
ncbi:MAG: exosortase K [Pyrinomonadaceae bacterium]|nr:exosortase K [Pyrinomonadaceae bacterium]